MTPEGHHLLTDERYDYTNDRSIDLENNEIEATYADIVSRIDRFLAASPLPDDPAGQVRRGTQLKIHESLTVIQKALQDYGFDGLALSFNGGKDCLVLLVLYIYVLYTTRTPIQRIPTCFVTPPQTFAEIDDFVTECADRYYLNVDRIALPMKAAFTQYLEHHLHVKAVLVGTRRTDPHGQSLTYFDPTNRGWPAFMRVHPVIDWHYWEVWDFLRGLKVPYCVLYDKGYTSLGGTLDTHPNPLLKNTDGSGFKPAYELLDESKERCGREH